MATGVIKQAQCEFIHNDLQKHADSHNRWESIDKRDVESILF